ncbi:hypothetical protein GCM10020331_025210 [Ectobacillus funiculus]
MMKPSTFEEAAQLYERMIRKQLKKRLCIYRNHDEFYQCGLIALWKAYEQFDERKGAFSTYAFLYSARLFAWEAEWGAKGRGKAGYVGSGAGRNHFS